MPLSELPNIYGYCKFADPGIEERKRGGVAVYVKNSLGREMTNVNYDECFISFQLKCSPMYIFIGVYIPPEGSVYEDTDAFARLCVLLMDSRKKNLTPFIGGDFNCRPGNLNELPLGWTYSNNCDSKTNSYGTTYFYDLCMSCAIMPINHLRYKEKIFMGGFTYTKSDKKSQIDFILTTSNGRENVQELLLIDDDWHLSDHRPLQLNLAFSKQTDIRRTLVRAVDLNKDIESNRLIKRFSSNYNYEIIKSFLEHEQVAIFQSVEQCNSDPSLIIHTLNEYIAAAHARPGAKVKKSTKQHSTTSYDECNIAYKEYNELLQTDNIDEIILTEAASRYNNIRGKLTITVLKKEHLKWENMTKNNDAKTLWEKIDWKGKLSLNPILNQPNISEIATHFEELYRADDCDESSKIHQLFSSVTIPVLDDPISEKEINEAIDKMKKGGYDYPLNVVYIIQSLFTPVLLFLMNLMFYVQYPVQCLVSLLFAIPKKGGTVKTFNYRGIQMMSSLACLFDRILAARLESWIPISDEQSAYQKGKAP